MNKNLKKTIHMACFCVYFIALFCFSYYIVTEYNKKHKDDHHETVYNMNPIDVYRVGEICGKQLIPIYPVRLDLAHYLMVGGEAPKGIELFDILVLSWSTEMNMNVVVKRYEKKRAAIEDLIDDAERITDMKRNIYRQ